MPIATESNQDLLPGVELSGGPVGLTEAGCDVLYGYQVGIGFVYGAAKTCCSRASDHVAGEVLVAPPLPLDTKLARNGRGG